MHEETAILAANMVKRSLAESGQIGHEEIKNVEVVPETTGNFVSLAEYDGMILCPIEGLSLEKDTNYYVKWDGITYSCNSGESGLVGNMSIAGGDDTGEPFLFTDGAAAAITEGQHTFSVRTVQKTIFPMSDKWFPKRPLETKEITCKIGSYVSLDGFDCLEFAERGVTEFYATLRIYDNGGDFWHYCTTMFTAADVAPDGVVRTYVSSAIIRSPGDRVFAKIDTLQDFNILVVS